MLLTGKARSRLTDKRSSVKKITLNDFMLRTEQAIIGLTQDLITGKMQLNIENNISLSLYLLQKSHQINLIKIKF